MTPADRAIGLLDEAKAALGVEPPNYAKARELVGHALQALMAVGVYDPYADTALRPNLNRAHAWGPNGPAESDEAATPSWAKRDAQMMRAE